LTNTSDNQKITFVVGHTKIDNKWEVPLVPQANQIISCPDDMNVFSAYVSK